MIESATKSVDDNSVCSSSRKPIYLFDKKHALFHEKNHQKMQTHNNVF